MGIWDDVAGCRVHSLEAYWRDPESFIKKRQSIENYSERIVHKKWLRKHAGFIKKLRSPVIMCIQQAVRELA